MRLNSILADFHLTNAESPVIEGRDGPNKGDRLMKTILAGAAFATFLALAFSAPSQASERPAVAEISAQQEQQSGTGYQGFYLLGQKSNQPTVNWDTTDQSLCSTAHDFCSGYHGDNG
jgi:hypothetical protein